MPVFRCYALNEKGNIIAREDVTSDDPATAIQIGWRFVASKPIKHEDATGLEVWHGSKMVFPGDAPD